MALESSIGGRTKAMSAGVLCIASAKNFSVDHVHWVAGGERVDLIIDVAELKVEFILGHETNMRSGKDIRAAQKSLASVPHRFGVEHIDRREKSGPW